MTNLSTLHTPGYIYPDDSVELPQPLIPNPMITEPTYSWRGVLLDSARTMWSVETILELLQLMHRYRFNRLHWHLTDNCGWRIPIEGYPRLLEISSQLPRMAFDDYNNVDPQKLAQYQQKARHLNNRGFYSRQDIALIVQSATKLGIEIIPEIDLPGHMEAVILAYPELGNPNFPVEITKLGDKYLRNNLLWPNQEAFEFIRQALKTVAELFPFEIVHIGGDECDFEFWENNLVAKRWMETEHITDGRALQGFFMQMAAEILNSYGKKVAVWDEATSTGLKGDELVFAWREEKGVPAAIASGQPWIFCDANYLYLNRLAGPAKTEPIGMYGTITVEDILQKNIPDNEQIQGIQACAWCEFITDRTELYYQLFPRLLAAAERAWCGNHLNLEDSLARVQLEMKILKDHQIL